MALTQREPSRRTLAKARRRQQLIDATIACIARKGLGGTTLGDVARTAGLSQGIVNLHFDSKENLLAETLRFLAEEYDAQFMRTLEAATPDPAQQLAALMDMDLSPALCERKKLAVWFAFWGEVKAVPTYQKICAARNRKYDDVMCKLATQIIEDGKYRRINAENVANALSAMTDGFWLSCLINPRDFDREAARRSVYQYFEAMFPRHFPRPGSERED